MDFRLVDSPALSPGHCYLCQAHSGPMVDTLRDDGLWRVYLCSRCVGIMGRLFEWTDPDETFRLRAELSQAEDRIDDLAGRLATADRDARVKIAAELTAA